MLSIEVGLQRETALAINTAYTTDGDSTTLAKHGITHHEAGNRFLLYSISKIDPTHWLRYVPYLPRRPRNNLTNFTLHHSSLPALLRRQRQHPTSNLQCFRQPTLRQPRREDDELWCARRTSTGPRQGIGLSTCIRTRRCRSRWSRGAATGSGTCQARSEPAGRAEAKGGVEGGREAVGSC